MEGTAREWAALDSWWESYVDSEQLVQAAAESHALDRRWFTDQWPELDSWWASHVDAEQSVLVDPETTSLDTDWLDGLWSELDPWWETYRQDRQEDITELLAVLDTADDAWAAGASQFDADPLSVDWQSAQGLGGPIRLGREEDWSHGLAHLLQSGGRTLLTELVGEEHSDIVVAVETEAHLPGGNETTRYEDILITHPAGGISIEVKLGDTNLAKTRNTAALVEQHYPGEWTHVLLLPTYQRGVLEETFGEDFAEPESGPPIIAAEQSSDIQVRYWREVSSALRTLLQRDSDLGPHWAASAYVFCTLIEQRIMGLVPRPATERLADTTDVVHDDVSLSVGIGDIESEIEYLRETTVNVDNE